MSLAAVAVCRQVTAWGQLGGATGPSAWVWGPGSCHLLSCCSRLGLSPPPGQRTRCCALILSHTAALQTQLLFKT